MVLPADPAAIEHSAQVVIGEITAVSRVVEVGGPVPVFDEQFNCPRRLDRVQGCKAVRECAARGCLELLFKTGFPFDEGRDNFVQGPV